MLCICPSGYIEGCAASVYVYHGTAIDRAKRIKLARHRGASRHQAGRLVASGFPEEPVVDGLRSIPQKSQNVGGPPPTRRSILLHCGQLPALGSSALVALARIHRKTTLGTVLEEARGCSSESGIMVLEQKTAWKQGSPNRCCHRTIPTGSASSLMTTA